MVQKLMSYYTCEEVKQLRDVRVKSKSHPSTRCNLPINKNTPLLYAIVQTMEDGNVIHSLVLPEWISDCEKYTLYPRMTQQKSSQPVYWENTKFMNNRNPKSDWLEYELVSYLNPHDLKSFEKINKRLKRLTSGLATTWEESESEKMLGVGKRKKIPSSKLQDAVALIVEKPRREGNNQPSSSINSSSSSASSNISTSSNNVSSNRLKRRRLHYSSGSENIPLANSQFQIIQQQLKIIQDQQSALTEISQKVVALTKAVQQSNGNIPVLEEDRARHATIVEKEFDFLPIKDPVQLCSFDVMVGAREKQSISLIFHWAAAFEKSKTINSFLRSIFSQLMEPEVGNIVQWKTRRVANELITGLKCMPNILAIILVTANLWSKANNIPKQDVQDFIDHCKKTRRIHTQRQHQAAGCVIRKN
ncbi:uncharacterized protein LOC124329385 isoform X2 [Daphnia pulicaria]|uniref:uncharacterized protein LOC124329385 isoform X2 n=1 Tax=Daphnia pulicaria TaxID=35523 RepID=UPI001EEB6220|nr:uncharacterized protein LOC124329385 isoform X2 [Daphnia pulicaria]